MEIRVCPKCSKAIYVSAEGRRVYCYNCGFVLLERRRAERTVFKTGVTCLVKGKKKEARLIDYSADGARISYRGRAIRANVLMEVDIDELGLYRTARAIWSKKASPFSSLSGINFLGA